MTRVYLDANVFLYAIGGESSYREPCRSVIDALRRGRLTGETSVTTLEEVVHHRRRRGDAEATERGRDVTAMCSAIHPLDLDTSLAALDIVDRRPQLQTGDAIHLATALANGLSMVVSADGDFDGLDGLERIDPLDRVALTDLLSE